ncbi:hypothetical protein, conserved [Babesia ovata]|uniref:C3H1-type domain-containing protein n=1 Tax=Babesia ovata TaxID=189622 RepID=A0A2H6KJJ8_9APIC|nr:uncharacterized protein BOVATA_046590 [Babesia ovata]GBE63166.1 hypothetical protein, conserved [Babesia ovata]
MTESDSKCISENLHNGQNGLHNVIRVVSEILSGYTKEVNKRTDNVNKSLSELSDHLGNQYVADVNNKINDSLEMQLTAWRDTVQSLETEVNKIQTDKINVLDKSLKSSVLREFMPVKSVVEHMKSVSLDGHLAPQVQQVDNQLLVQQAHMVGSIKDRCEGLQKTLDDECKKVVSQIDHLEGEKKSHFVYLKNELKDAKRDAQHLVTYFYADYEGVILTHYDNIKDSLALVDPTKNSSQNSNHYDAVNALTEKVEKIEEAYQNKLKDVRQKVVNAVGERDDSENSLLLSLTKLEEDVKRDLLAIRQKVEREMKDYVKHYVRLVKSEVESIKKKVGKENGDSKDSIAKHWHLLKVAITGLVGEINGKDSDTGKPYYRGLKGIKERVANYTKTFKDSFEDTILDGWISRILKGNGVVNGRLDKYVNEDTAKVDGKYKIPEELHNAVKKEIKEKLKEGVIDTAREQIRLTDVEKANTQENIEAVVKFLHIFVERLEAELKKPEPHDNPKSFVNSIAVKVEEDEQWTSRKPKASIYDRYLRSAIRYILMTLVIIARQTASALWSFTTAKDSKSNRIAFYLGYNLEEAIIIAAEISKEFDVSQTGSGLGRKFQTVLENVRSQIEALENNLSQEVFEGEVNTILNDNIGKQYKTTDQVDKPFNDEFMNAYKKATSAEIGAERGALRQKIDDIKKHVTEYTDATGNINVLSIPDLITASRGDDQGAKPSFSSAMREILSKIKTLEAVPADVAKKRNEAFSKLEELRGKIDTLNDKIKYISALVDGGEETLETAVTTLRLALSEAKSKTNNGITKLRKDLLQQVDTSFKSLTTAVKSMFAEQHKADLKALNALVEKQKNIIGKMIKDDKMTGIKGLLKTMDYRENKLDKLQKAVTPPNENHATKFKNLSESFHNYVNHLHNYILHRLISKTPNGTLHQLQSIHSQLQTLLSHLREQKHFTHEVPGMLQKLKTSVQALTSTAFGNPAYPVLDAFPKSLLPFVEQLERGYVNRYEGDAATYFSWNKPFSTEFNNLGNNCAKAFLTSLQILVHDFSKLARECPGTWKDKQICLTEFDQKLKVQVPNDLGAWLRRCSYEVSEFGKQNGELQDKSTMKGTNILEKVTHKIAGAEKVEALKKWKESKKQNGNHIGLFDILVFLFGHLESYYKVCHYCIPAKPKAPTTVNQMLHWLNGLRWNPVYWPLRLHLMELFPKPMGMEEKTHKEIGSANLKLEAHPYTITPKDLDNKLLHVCMYCQDTLVAILGHGQEQGRYAVDFYTNIDGLSYPSDPGQCFDLLLDISFRLYDQLFFLYKQCYNGTTCAGWQDCHYGLGVGGSAFTCNSNQCPNQECPLIADQKTKQTSNQSSNQNADQTINQHTDCGLKSPLQSFLEDGLQGFLPHTFTKPGCKLECSVANHNGIPCKTPMGFSYIGVAASHTQTGANLKKALEKFCGPKSPLLQLCNMLNCLLRRPPQTLGDMFAFYHKFLNKWDKEGQTHKQYAFAEAVKMAYFGARYDMLTIASIQNSSAHSKHLNNENKQLTGDMFSLFSCEPQGNPVHPCGPYLQPIYTGIRDIYTKDHSDYYLSWIVYITEKFYELLKKLYDECRKKCNTPGSRCHDTSCAEMCPVTHQPDRLPSSTHDAKCASIVKCQNTHPALYAAGFTFGSPFALSGEESDAAKRTCQDFCNTLKEVLSDKEADNAPLAKLIYVIIPNFLWEIRKKFSYLLLGLWSLSLLYLLHIAVVRLDVLRIRSHLRSPSSHRIAAQSLLAAARVKALANVKYFSP